MQATQLGLIMIALSGCFATRVAQAEVRLVQSAAGYELLRDGEPFFIKGAGGNSHLEALRAAGGNSIRTWGTDNLGPLLDRAQALGLTVTAGFWVGHERHGFNYDDAQAVAEQLAHVERDVRAYRDHPALLMWAFGNEMEGDGSNPKIWQAVNAMARAAKAIDTNHPIMTVIAEIGGDKVRNFNTYCPDVDVLGINSYGGVPSIRQRYVEAGGVKPIVITEFGPPGQWEIQPNAWGVPTEMNSTRKAEWYAQAYADGIAAQRDLCLGGYAFIWGFKQEATATWYGMFLKDGSRLGAVEAMTAAWDGPAPSNRCPQISDVTVDRDRDLQSGDLVHAAWSAIDPDGDPLDVRWVLRRDSGQYETGGDDQTDTPEYPDAVVTAATTTAVVRVPQGGGSYRLFAYAYDGKGNAAVANIPLKVEGPELPPPLPVAKIPFHLYTDAEAHTPYAPSGFMGNTGAIQADLNCAELPHHGATCQKWSYQATDNWGGVMWQSPANDWGQLPGGRNLTGATDLVFWARGDQGGEVLTFFIGGIDKDAAYPDTDRAELKDLKLQPTWTRYRIPLDGRDLSRIKTGFAWSLAGQGRPITFYLDDIAYE